jgi:hypothetical protein
LLDDPMPIADRNDIGSVLREKHGARIETGTVACVHLPGYFARDGRQPFMVMGHGAAHGGMETRRYTAEHLRGAFLGWPEEPAEPPKAPEPENPGEKYGLDRQTVEHLRHKLGPLAAEQVLGKLARHRRREDLLKNLSTSEANAILAREVP